MRNLSVYTQVVSVTVLFFIMGMAIMGSMSKESFANDKATTDKLPASPAIAFETIAELENWVIVNDTVMGGRSRAQMQLQDNMLVFSGTLSLKNNGGFASIRRVYDPKSWLTNQAIQIKVIGDGRDYQFRLLTNRFMDGVAYVANFETVKGEETTLSFTAADFTPQFRGRLVKGAPQLSFEDIQQLGFMLADSRPGEFALKVASIEQALRMASIQ
ncbi:CIA30 family protein [Glaciecola siphonariae]|uniref:CIA30 family protein n=1 Tax=Glaciecola siphonariae TaxID=521012 RepID=A0ABV9LYW2_9ALTE